MNFMVGPFVGADLGFRDFKIRRKGGAGAAAPLRTGGGQPEKFFTTFVRWRNHRGGCIFLGGAPEKNNKLIIFPFGAPRGYMFGGEEGGAPGGIVGEEEKTHPPPGSMLVVFWSPHERGNNITLGARMEKSKGVRVSTPPPRGGLCGQKTRGFLPSE